MCLSGSDQKRSPRRRETCCFPLSCYRRMHEECLVIDPRHPSTHTPLLTLLTHIAPHLKLRSGHWKSTPSSLLPPLTKENRIITSPDLFCSGVKLPSCHDSDQPPLHLFLPKLNLGATTPSTTPPPPCFLKRTTGF
ncbi:hypothetical protein INR49_017395 [Caranx melampygus]|nr:hypothetical protein INR49_017395 [Caranx melampygus]